MSVITSRSAPLLPSTLVVGQELTKQIKHVEPAGMPRNWARLLSVHQDPCLHLDRSGKEEGGSAQQDLIKSNIRVRQRRRGRVSYRVDSNGSVESSANKFVLRVAILTVVEE